MLRPEIERWAIPADLERVGPLVLELAGFLEQHGVASGSQLQAQLLLEEIVSNVVRHAYFGDQQSDVRVQVDLDEAGIALVVEDEAGPFDPFREAPVPGTHAALEQRQFGGLGLHLVKQIADEFSYERRGAANRVRLLLTRKGA